MREDDEQAHGKATLLPEQRQEVAEELVDNQHHNLPAGVMSKDAMPHDDKTDDLLLKGFSYVVDYGDITPPTGCCRKFEMEFDMPGKGKWGFAPPRKPAQPVEVQHKATVKDDLPNPVQIREKWGWLNLAITSTKKITETFEGRPHATCAEELERFIQEQNLQNWDWCISEREYSPREILAAGFCCWKLQIRYTRLSRWTPDSFNSLLLPTHHTILLHGRDRGHNNAARLSFERPLLEYALRTLQALRASTPRHISSLGCMVMEPEGAIHWWLYNDEDGNRAHLQRRQGRREEEVYVHPELVSRIDDILQKYQNETWHGFESPAWSSEPPKACAFEVNYDTEQQIHVRCIAGKAGCMPPGFSPAISEVLAALHDAMYSPTRHAGPWNNRPHGLINLSYSKDGELYNINYSLYRRLDPDGTVLRLSRHAHPYDDHCTVCVASVEKLETLLAESGMLSWGKHKEFDPEDATLTTGGTSISLEIAYADGRKVKSESWVCSSQGYQPVEKLGLSCQSDFAPFSHPPFLWSLR